MCAAIRCYNITYYYLLIIHIVIPVCILSHTIPIASYIDNILKCFKYIVECNEQSFIKSVRVFSKKCNWVTRSPLVKYFSEKTVLYKYLCLYNIQQTGFRRGVGKLYFVEVENDMFIV